MGCQALILARLRGVLTRLVAFGTVTQVLRDGISPHNVARVLELVWTDHGISRGTIAERLDLNKGTVSRIVSALEDIGLVKVASIGSAGPLGGRKPVGLRISTSWGCLLGLEVNTERLSIVAIDLAGAIIYRHTETVDHSRQSLARTVAAGINEHMRILAARGLRVLGVGLGLPALVDPGEGLILRSMPLEIDEPVSVHRDIAPLLNEPVALLVENDANCCCFGELTLRRAARPRDFIYVLGEYRRHKLSTPDLQIGAVGMGFVIGGRVHRGLDFSAGEFRSVLYRTGQYNQFSIPDEDARRLLRDPAVSQRISDELGENLGFLVNSLDLQLVIVGGAIASLRDQLARAVEIGVRRQWAYSDQVLFRVELSHLGDSAVPFGAAAMFCQYLFVLPASERQRATMEAGIASRLFDRTIASALQA